MPRAGWCRECGEWVWVDDEGACQHGHGPECVGGIYDATPQDAVAAPEAGFGDGEMPDDLYRFSWAAFVLPLPWGLAYGVWPFVLLWLACQLALLALGQELHIGTAEMTLEALVGATVVAEVASGIIRLWAGVNAHALLWRKEAFRLKVLPGSKPRFGVARFKSRQRVWTQIGWTLVLAGLVASLVMGYELWKTFGLGLGGIAPPLVFMGAEVWLGVWLSLKMRDERPGVPGSAEEPAEHSV